MKTHILLTIALVVSYFGYCYSCKAVFVRPIRKYRTIFWDTSL